MLHAYFCDIQFRLCVSGEGVLKNATGCFGETILLSCPDHDDLVIDVTESKYRMSLCGANYTDCCPSPGDCTGDQSDARLDVIKRECQHVQSCGIRADWTDRGCWPATDYETIFYSCIPGSTVYQLFFFFTVRTYNHEFLIAKTIHQNYLKENCKPLLPLTLLL